MALAGFWSYIMNAERYQELKEAFFRIRELPSTERDAQIAEIEGRDPEFAEELRRLLRAGIQDDGFLEAKADQPPIPEDLAADRGYKVLSEISRGGMAVVYLAERTDGEFRHRVAIKVLHLFASGPESVLRLRLERQILAGLKHPHIARMLDGGTTPDGYPYMVMELIDGGKPIDAWCRDQELDLHRRLQLILLVCDAVSYAHRNLVVHRDLKPNNILVTRDGDPKLLDFGIAKLIGEDVTNFRTSTGFQPLTPRYASPEQLLGEHITTSADIYSLGVLLFELMADCSPYGEAATSVARLTHMILYDEPVPPSVAVLATGSSTGGSEFRLRQRARELRGDLDAICLKALRKSPEDRYSSVDELAEDLRRYLTGLPVHARRPSLFYRARKYIAKYRAVVTVSTVALIIVIALTGYNLHTRRRAAEQARIAQNFGAEVEKIDSIMRTTYLLPLHDIRPAKERVRAALRRIEVQMQQIGGAADAAGHFAIGHGQMALQNFSEARRHLDMAWNHELRGPDVASARGLTLGELYRNELDSVKRIRDKKQQEARRQKIEREFRNPAVALLRQGIEELPPEYGEGLIAYYENNYQKALMKAQAAAARDSSLYQARLLEGDAHVALASEKRDRGQDDAAMAEYLLGCEAYDKAGIIARSDPRCYASVCELWNDVMKMDISGKGGDLKAHYEVGRKAADTAIIADPERALSYLALAKIHLLLAQYQIRHGEDPTESLTAATNAAQKGILLGPPAGIQPASLVAIAQYFQGVYNDAAGIDPSVPLDTAIKNFDKVLQADPGASGVWLNSGAACLVLAQFQGNHGKDPNSALTEAVRRLKMASDINPQDVDPLSNLSGAYILMADNDFARGRDPRAHVQESIRCFEKATAINPTNPPAWINVAEGYSCLASFELSKGRDPSSAVGKAQQCLDKALQTNPDFADAHTMCGEIRVVMAEYERLAGKNPEHSLQSAEKSYRTALRIDKNFAGNFVNVATIQLNCADGLLKEGRSPEPFLSTARTFLEKARAANPTMSLIHRELGRLEILTAQWQTVREQNPEKTFVRAQSEIEKAIASNPNGTNSYLHFAELCRYQAEWKKKETDLIVAKGLEMAGKALTINPLLAPAVATRGALFLIQARHESDPSHRVESARRSVDELQRAFIMNPLLRHDYQHLLDSAKQIAEQ